MTLFSKKKQQIEESVYGVFARLDMSESSVLHGLYHNKEDANRRAEELKLETWEIYTNSHYCDVQVRQLKIQ
jgi:hypothetical protein